MLPQYLIDGVANPVRAPRREVEAVVPQLRVPPLLRRLAAQR